MQPSHRRTVRTFAGVSALVWALSATVAAGPGLDHTHWFASVVHEYTPAPGQFVNLPGADGTYFNDPAAALGPPVGGGTLSADNSAVVTLGGFGGTIVLGFADTVWDDPCNPMGLDAIVFTNAFWVSGNPNRRWAEAAVIEISRDVNGNGLPDDPWYVIPGSHLPAAPSSVLRTQAWDNDPNTPTPPTNINWYPAPPHFPGFPDAYTTQGYELPSLFTQSILTNPNGLSATVEGVWGYGGLSPTLLLGDMSGATGNSAHDNRLDQPEDLPGVDPAFFYTTPDDPFTVGVSPGSGGGDAFDIAWAVDPETGAPANLDGFDFIRLRTGVDALAGPGGVLGEISMEVAGVARVRARSPLAGDANGDGVVDFEDLALLLGQFGQSGECLAGDLNGDGVVDFADLAMVLANFGTDIH